MQHSFNQIIFEIKSLLGQGKTKEVIEKLNLGYFQGHQKEIILISNRWEDFKRQQVQGVLTSENINVFRNQINHDIFELIQLIETEKVSTNRRRSFSYLIPVILLIGSFFAYNYFGSTSNLKKASEEISQSEAIKVIKTNEKPVQKIVKKSKIELAIKDCEEQVKDEFDSYVALDIGKCVIEKGYFEEGIEVALSAFDQPMNDNRKAGAYVTLSKMYEGANNYTEAIVQMKNAMKIKPNFQRFEKRFESLKATKYASQ